MTVTITVVGGLTDAPEIRYSPNGIAIASGTIASTDRYLDKQTNEWRDGKKLFLRWSAFRDLAENVAGSNLQKGAQVSITGKLHTRQYTDRDNNPRSVTELEVHDFAVSLRFATAQVTRAQSSGGAQGGAGQPQTASDGSWPANPAGGGQADAWSTPGSFGDDTPF